MPRRENPKHAVMSTKILLRQAFPKLLGLPILIILLDKKLVEMPSVAYSFFHFTVNWISTSVLWNSWCQTDITHSVIEKSLTTTSTSFYFKVLSRARLVRVFCVAVVVVVMVAVLEC